MQHRSHSNFKKTQLRICTRFKRGIPLFLFLYCVNIFVLTMQIEALTTQLRNHRNFKKTQLQS